MYLSLLSLHSFFRWLVLISLLFAIYRAWRGYKSNSIFTKTDNSVRHWTATIAQIQMTIGITLYFQSPIIKYFLKNFSKSSFDTLFFGLIHISLMIVAVVIVTIGSALAKRKNTDQEKFKTMLVWFTITLIIIFIAIPWPFSPLANRPYIR